MANSRSQPITVGRRRQELIYGDSQFVPTVKDSGTEIGAWNSDIRKWEGYSNTTLSNGQAATQFVYENNQNLTNLTSQAINNLDIDTRLAYKNNGTFDYRINTNIFPTAGAIQDGEGNSNITSVVSGPQNQISSNTSKDVLRYPLYESQNYDYFQVTCFKYEPSRFGAGAISLPEADKRITSSVGTVFLPMQPGISESNSVGWGQDQLNALQIAGAGIAKNAIFAGGNLDFGKLASGLVMDTAEAARALSGDIGAEQIANYFAGQAVGANIFTRGTGQVLNPNLELLFSGPNLRTFNYSYRFTPRDDDEAREIKQIVKFFKKNMAPKKSDNSLFLSTPNVFKLKYIYANGDQHPFLNKIKVCALTGFSVDYTPDGSYMTYQDGSMTSYSVNMQFNELDPIYDKDYEEDTNDMGY